MSNTSLLNPNNFLMICKAITNNMPVPIIGKQQYFYSLWLSSSLLALMCEISLSLEDNYFSMWLLTIIPSYYWSSCFQALFLEQSFLTFTIQQCNLTFKEKCYLVALITKAMRHGKKKQCSGIVVIRTKCPPKNPRWEKQN